MAFDDPFHELDYDLRRPVIEALEPGESIRWAGRPDPGGLRRDFVPIAIGVAWLGAVIWVFFMQGADNPPWYIAVPFVLAGLALFAAPLRKRRRLTGRLYVLTDHRALLFEGTGKSGARRHCVPLTRGSRVRRTSRRGGGGDLWFETAEAETVRLDRDEPAGDRSHPKARRLRKIGFTRLADPDTPHALIEEMIRP